MEKRRAKSIRLLPSRLPPSVRTRTCALPLDFGCSAEAARARRLCRCVLWAELPSARRINRRCCEGCLHGATVVTGARARSNSALINTVDEVSAAVLARGESLRRRLGGRARVALGCWHAARCRPDGANAASKKRTRPRSRLPPLPAARAALPAHAAPRRLRGGVHLSPAGRDAYGSAYLSALSSPSPAWTPAPALRTAARAHAKRKMRAAAAARGGACGSGTHERLPDAAGGARWSGRRRPPRTRTACDDIRGVLGPIPPDAWLVS
eukprot:364631-Chlamydomonas_euryale.AAC.27